MKTIILILSAVATMLFARCLDADGQRLPMQQGAAEPRTPLLEMGAGHASLTPTVVMRHSLRTGREHASRKGNLTCQ